MAEITGAAVKALREKTGAGMMECKKALTEAGGNEEQAIEILRKRGMATADPHRRQQFIAFQRSIDKAIQFRHADQTRRLTVFINRATLDEVTQTAFVDEE